MQQVSEEKGGVKTKEVKSGWGLKDESEAIGENGQHVWREGGGGVAGLRTCLADEDNELGCYS